MAYPMPEPDLDRLEAYLNATERIDSTLSLDGVQGLCAAVVSGPAPIPESAWLAEVLGEDHRFATPQEASDITDLLARFHDDTARQLDRGDGFDFILYGPEGGEDLAAWAEGYLLGVDLADPPWDELAEPSDIENMLFPFLMLTGMARELALENGEDWMGEDEEADLLAQIREGLASHLVDVRQFWLEKKAPG